MPLWYRIVRIWLPIAVVATALTGFTYLGIQQSYRNGLDDPQLQLATDAAAALDAGASPASVVGSATVDAEKSLAPFVAVFGADGNLLASSGTLDAPHTLGRARLAPPRGILAEARVRGTNRVTWQPRPGVRIATVSVRAEAGRVVFAGRNMRAVEARIDDLGLIAASAWAITMVALLVVVGLLEWFGLRFSAS